MVQSHFLEGVALFTFTFRLGTSTGHGSNSAPIGWRLTSEWYQGSGARYNSGRVAKESNGNKLLKAKRQHLSFHQVCVWSWSRNGLDRELMCFVLQLCANKIEGCASSSSHCLYPCHYSVGGQPPSLCKLLFNCCRYRQLAIWVPWRFVEPCCCTYHEVKTEVGMTYILIGRCKPQISFDCCSRRDGMTLGGARIPDTSDTSHQDIARRRKTCVVFGQSQKRRHYCKCIRSSVLLVLETVRLVLESGVVSKTALPGSSHQQMPRRGLLCDLKRLCKDLARSRWSNW